MDTAGSGAEIRAALGTDGCCYCRVKYAVDSLVFQHDDVAVGDAEGCWCAGSSPLCRQRGRCEATFSRRGIISQFDSP